jgi:hypothetical protein
VCAPTALVLGLRLFNMRRMTTYKRILPLCLVVGCGGVASDEFGPEAIGPDDIGVESSAIINGQPDSTHVSVGHLLDYADNTLCSVVLVGPQTALTAAHCVDGANPNTLGIQFTGAGFFPYGPLPPNVDVAAFEVHPSYNPNAFYGQHDIAVLRLTQPVTTIAPTVVALGALALPAATVTLVGYGPTTPSGTATERNSASTNVLFYYLDELWVHVSDGASICQGDSGGPALATGTFDAVVGIASGELYSCSYGIFQQTDTELNFILDASNHDAWFAGFTNPNNASDLDMSGGSSISDLLLLLQLIDRDGTGALSVPNDLGLFPDVNGDNALTGADGYGFGFHNPLHPCDTNADGNVTPSDALRIINAISAGVQLVQPNNNGFLDVNNDNVLSTLDALTVINGLSGPSSGCASTFVGPLPPLP